MQLLLKRLHKQRKNLLKYFKLFSRCKNLSSFFYDIWSVLWKTCTAPHTNSKKKDDEITAESKAKNRTVPVKNKFSVSFFFNCKAYCIKYHNVLCFIVKKSANCTIQSPVEFSFRNLTRILQKNSSFQGKDPFLSISDLFLKKIHGR